MEVVLRGNWCSFSREREGRCFIAAVDVVSTLVSTFFVNLYTSRERTSKRARENSPAEPWLFINHPVVSMTDWVTDGWREVLCLGLYATALIFSTASADSLMWRAHFQCFPHSIPDSLTRFFFYRTIFCLTDNQKFFFLILTGQRWHQVARML